MANFTGTIGNDTLVGTADADVIDGLAGNDILYGGLGDDRLTGGAGADRLNGGDGLDAADYSGSAAGVTVVLGGAAGVGGDAAGDTLFNIENAVGSAFDEEGNELTAGASRRFDRFAAELEWYAEALKRQREEKGVP